MSLQTEFQPLLCPTAYKQINLACENHMKDIKLIVLKCHLPTMFQI